MAWIELSGKQQLALRNALVGAYLTEALFDELLLASERSLDAFAPSKDDYPVRVLAVVKRANREGWIADLIASAREQRPNDPDIKRIADDLKAFARPQVKNPFTMCLLSGGHILVNRTDLRTALLELYKGNKRILVVKDDATLAAQARKQIKTGKSHSLQLISFVQEVTGAFEIAAVDLAALGSTLASGELIQPYHLAKSICSLMKCGGIVTEKAKDGQWARWSLTFCDEFEPVAKDIGKIWIVIDSFHLVLLPDETKGLLKEMATRINRSLPNLRMVLLGYPDTFQHPISPTVTEETLRLIGEDELAEFFARAYQEENIPFDEDKVAGKVSAVLDGLDATQPDFVIQVSSLALAELRKR